MDGENNSFKCVHLSIDKLPFDMIEYFIVFDKSKLFVYIWDEYCGKLDKTNVTFNDIYHKAWKPTIASCKDLLDKLCNESFTYSDIKCFNGMKAIQFHVTTLLKAMQKYDGSSIPSLPENQWISRAVENIPKHLDFVNSSVQVDAVKLCLHMKKLLSLQGDFSDMNYLAKHISVRLSSHTVVRYDKLRVNYLKP